MSNIHPFKHKNIEREHLEICAEGRNFEKFLHASRQSWDAWRLSRMGDNKRAFKAIQSPIRIILEIYLILKCTQYYASGGQGRFL